MAIVHPAFCGIIPGTMEPNAAAKIFAAAVRPVDTKHCKNRVYSPRSPDVFSSSTRVRMRRLLQAKPDNKNIGQPRSNGELSCVTRQATRLPGA
jgi:hypothetical protein